MKTALFTLFLTFLAPALFSQEWFPIGASWYYNQVDFMLPGERYQYFEVLGDTVIQGKACRIVSGDCICKDLGVTGYLHQDGERISYYDGDKETFVLLYDFGMAIGDTMTFSFSQSDDTHYILDSVAIIMFNGVSLRVQYWRHLDGWVEIGPRTYEFIGNTRCLYPQIGNCDPLTGPMRCYYDGDFGLIKFIDPDEDCDKITSSATDIAKSEVLVYPNPSHGNIIITTDQNLHSLTCFNIVSGEFVFSKERIPTGQEISVDNLFPGIYLLNCLMQDGSNAIHKLVIY